jgi:exodeoxyribonuclease V alpha subunit
MPTASTAARCPRLDGRWPVRFLLRGRSKIPTKAAQGSLQSRDREDPFRLRTGLSAFDVQVLCPMNRGRLGARSLNVELQKVAESYRRAADRALRLDLRSRRQGDADRERLRQGRLQRRHRLHPIDRRRPVRDDHRLRRQPREIRLLGPRQRVVLAYATTIHKAQGSEYPAVVVPITMQHYVMLRRNLLYTAVTRGRRLVVLVGQRKALAIAVKGRRETRRWSKLKDWLSGSGVAS